MTKSSQSNSQTNKRCVFCGHPEVTVEHVIPVWAALLLKDHFGDTKWEAHRGAEKYWKTVKPEMTVRRVCEHKCNNGWMSQLETHAKPILAPIILGEGAPIVLTSKSQLILANWAYKTVLMADFLNNEKRRMYLKSAYTGFFDNQRPPDQCGIWIAGHAGARPEVSTRPQLAEMKIQRKDGGAVSHQFQKPAAIFTITIFRAVFQVITYDAPTSFPPNAMHDLVLARRLWPPRPDAILWPPGRRGMNDAELNRFSLRNGII